MRFLHISDLHFGIEKKDKLKETSKILRENYSCSLFKQIESIVKENPIDFIVVTGDIAYTAKEIEYNDAKKWLTDLLKICKLENHHLFICPGNHDIDRDRVEEIRYPENLEDVRTLLCVERIDKLKDRFYEYCNFFKEMNLPLYKIRERKNELIGIYESKEYRIICINTAWYAVNDKVKDKMWIGDLLIETIKNYLETVKSKPTITIMHHPKTSWNENERSSYENNINVYYEICRFSDLILTGHTHEILLNQEKNGKACISSGGATYQSGVYQNNFCVYDIDWENCGKALKKVWSYTVNNKDAPWKSEEYDLTDYLDKFIQNNRKNKSYDFEPYRRNLIKSNSCDDFLKAIENMSFEYLDKLVLEIKDAPKKVKILEKTMGAFVSTSTNCEVKWKVIVETILNESNGKVGLLLRGFQGTGKSTFLSLLYLRLKNAYNSQKTCRVPVFIDLHCLDQYTLEEAKKKINENLMLIERLLKENISFFLIFDGCDDYLRVNFELEKTIQEFIIKHNGKFILCVGHIDENNHKYGEGFRSPILNGIEQCDINLKSHGFICRNGLSLKKVVENLLAILSKESIQGDTIVNLLDSLDFIQIDFRTIYTFIRLIVLSPDKNYINPGIVFYEYFITKLQNQDNLYKESQIALLYRTEFAKWDRNIFIKSEVLFKNKITRDFLTAYYFLQTVLKMREYDFHNNKSTLQSSNEDLKRLFNVEYIFTPEVNHMIRDLLIMYKEQQATLVRKLIHIYNHASAKQNIKLQICYVLGRITTTDAKQKARDFLLQEYEFYNEILYGKKNKEKRRKEIDIVIYRTIAVSLIILGEKKYEEEYIGNLIYDHELNSINRGFNCAYYKDKVYHLGNIPEYKDDLNEPELVDNTMTKLIDHIEKAINGTKKYLASMHMEIITLFSLYESRMDNVEMQKKYKKKLLSLAEEIQKSNKIYSNIIKYYVSAMIELIAQERPYHYIFSELYKTKFEKRTGWVSRCLSHPESVMDHMYSTYILGVFLLPETKYELDQYMLNDASLYEDYDKHSILTTVLIHDMGENYIGDKLEKTEEDKRKENERFEYYGLLCTLPKLYGLGRDVERWRELFKKSTINAQIANDLDKIEPLIQAYMYKERGEKVDLDEWKISVEGKLMTSLGRNIFNFVIKNILCE